MRPARHALHFRVDNWREMDPNNTLGLLDPQGAADTGAGQNDRPAAPERT